MRRPAETVDDIAGVPDRQAATLRFAVGQVLAVHVGARNVNFAARFATSISCSKKRRTKCSHSFASRVCYCFPGTSGGAWSHGDFHERS